MTQIKVICGYDVEEKSSEVVETSEVFYFAFGQERMTTRGWNPLRHSLWSQRKALGAVRAAGVEEAIHGLATTNKRMDCVQFGYP